MRRKLVLAGTVCLIGSCFFQLRGRSVSGVNDSSDTKITIEWNKEKQLIDGFGIAEADWADDLFLFENRDHVMDLLFGNEGLRLNILRGEIFPHYWETVTDKDFDVHANINLAEIHDKLQTISAHDLLRRGQLWVTREAHDKYKLNKLVFSVWSPPVWMKTNSDSVQAYWASQGKLRPEHYQDFADYLVAFYEAYQSVGIRPYAISPSNEPGYAAPWNSCVWTANEMGRFIADYLGPTFEKNRVSSRIIFGENPAWSVNCDMLRMISSLDFTTEILHKYPQITRFNPIAAGHAYLFPDTLKLPAECLQTPIVPFKVAEENGVPVWVTEVSDITPLNVSMQDGLRWATMFHQYLVEANVNAIVWWCGAMPTTTNESLIILGSDRKQFTLAKRYDTFGNYTRYIPEGSRRIETKNTTPLLVSAFRKDKHYTIVMINSTKNEIHTTLNLAARNVGNQLRGYITNQSVRWQENLYKIGKNNEVTLQIPGESVVSFIGVLE